MSRPAVIVLLLLRCPWIRGARAPRLHSSGSVTASGRCPTVILPLASRPWSGSPYGLAGGRFRRALCRSYPGALAVRSRRGSSPDISVRPGRRMPAAGPGRSRQGGQPGCLASRRSRHRRYDRSAARAASTCPNPSPWAQRDRLVAIADIATPNRFEIGWLTGRPVETLTEISTAARALGPKRVVVTSAPAPDDRQDRGGPRHGEQRPIVAENQMVEGAPNGTGDLFAALFLSRLIGGASDEAALAAASASTFEVIARSVKAGGRELDLVDQQDAPGPPDGHGRHSPARHAAPAPSRVLRGSRPCDVRDD